MNTLADVIARLDELPDDLTIYAAPKWRPSSAAMALAEPADGRVPDSAHGLTYLVEVATAKSVLASRKGWRPDRALSLADKCDAIIYFAVYDESEPLPSVFSAEVNAGGHDARSY